MKCLLLSERLYTFAAENDDCLKEMKKILTLITILMVSQFSRAEDCDSLKRMEFGMQYDAELQTDFKKKSNFLNLLRLDGSLQLTKCLRMNVSTISFAKAKDGIASDMQTFSNLEIDDNIPLTLAVAGMEWERETQSGVHKVFVGVRGTVEDYFTSDVTAFFQNSSWGIHPTISANGPIATYPYASMSVHYEYQSERWGAKATIYDGGEHYRFTGKENLFRVCPKSDGIFAMAQGEYKTNGGSVFLGGSIYKDSPTLWTYGEQCVGEYSNGSLNLIAAYSHSFDKEAECRNFVGAGAKWNIDKIELGAFADYADYQADHEFASELSCNIPLNNFLSLKSSLHYINGTTEKGFIGMMRMTVAF